VCGLLSEGERRAEMNKLAKFLVSTALTVKESVVLLSLKVHEFVVARDEHKHDCGCGKKAGHE
jgi:hypothetical protein